MIPDRPPLYVRNRWSNSTCGTGDSMVELSDGTIKQVGIGWSIRSEEDARTPTYAPPESRTFEPNRAQRRAAQKKRGRK